VPVGGAHEVKLAGSFVAWSEMAFWETPERNEVIVYDWVARTVAYRVNVEALIPPDHPDGYEWHYDLQHDGRLVLAYRRMGFGGPAELAWFSPADPVAHRIPVELHTPYVAAEGNLVAGCRARPFEAVVFDLQGRIADRLDTTDPTYQCHVAFDGARVAWVNAARKPALYFDRFPASEPEIAPLVEEPAPEPVQPATTGAVTLGKQDVDCTSFAAASCSVETTLATASAVIGHSSYRVRAGRAEPLRVRLTRAGRRLVKRARKVRSRMSVAVQSPLGDRARKAFRVTLLSRR
jgi:hypothetical protein